MRTGDLGRPLRILIVDDDEVDRMSIRRALQHSPLDVHVEEAEDGDKGLEAILHRKPDCTFLDYRLPPSDGLAVLKKAHAAHADSPIVMLTGEGDEQLVVEVIRAGASDYLSKAEVSSENLARTIQHAIRIHRFELAQRRLASFPEQSPNPILEISLEGDVLYLNPAAARRFPDLGPNAITHSMLASWDSLATALLSNESDVVNREVVVGDATYHQTVSTAPGRMSLRIYATDITERKKAEEQLIHSAFYDPLTSLPNRALFVDRLGRAIERAKHHLDYLFAVLFLDLDRFKVINDGLGHLQGDELLIATARRLEEVMRTEDTVSRFGGDEFAILIDDPEDISQITHIANRVLRQFVRPFELTGREVFTSASIGIVLSTGGYDQPPTLLRDADTAMYRAKAQGGARFQVFDTEMHAQAVTMLQMETELRHALERDQLCLCFQPIVSLADGRISWFEALVRWRHPRLGMIRPDEFLPLAEETGIITDVDRWVLQRSYQQLARWRRSFSSVKVPGVSVNVSNASLAQGDILSQVCRLRDATGFGPGELGLALEITETAIMKRIDLTVGLLSELKPLGIKISVDDFGTGYSSLSYLRRLPIDTLKIDRSFVHDLEQDQENLEIVQTIIDLARSLGLKVVAEGIERRPQYERIRAMRGDYCQGYWFSRPVTSEGAEKMIAESRHWE